MKYATAIHQDCRKRIRQWWEKELQPSWREKLFWGGRGARWNSWPLLRTMAAPNPQIMPLWPYLRALGTTKRWRRFAEWFYFVTRVTAMLSYVLCKLTVMLCKIIDWVLVEIVVPSGCMYFWNVSSQGSIHFSRVEILGPCTSVGLKR